MATYPSEHEDLGSTDDDHPATESAPKPTTIWQKTYGFFGFRNGYNFPLWFIFGGAMFGFCLARLQYLSISIYSKNAAVGEWYWYSQGFYKIGIMLHLASVVPAGILMVWQFVPIVRYKFILFHRINGYICVTLLVAGTAGALMIARRSFGGAVSTQCAIGLLAILVIVGLALAVYNIKRLQIDQHRAWMLRVWFYCGAIITMRLIMIITAVLLPMVGDYYGTLDCKEMRTLVGPKLMRSTYPECSPGNGTAHDFVAAGPAKLGPDNAATAVALQTGFAMAAWLAIFIHVVAVEVYLKLTPAEGERLRVVSYDKQLKAGFNNPGSAGLVVERWGDATPWRHPELTAKA